MRYSGLFYINNPSSSLDTSSGYINDIVQGIEANLQHVNRGNGWALSYRVFRETVDPKHQSQTEADGKPKPVAYSYQHLLNHTNIAGDRTYIHIRPSNGQGVITSMPRSQQDAHVALIRYQMAALWVPRHALRIEQGTTYESGLYTIHVGELRATREGPQSGATYSPGVVVSISTAVGNDAIKDRVSGQSNGATEKGTTLGEEDLDFEYAQAMIRECWRRIKGSKDFGGRAEVKEVMMFPAFTNRVEQEREAAVRMWCEVLRLRG